ncbi:MAG: hypothetical protein OER88_04280 [Planctomycetota bacterium]|nr:hypothetical protein [Planctomycetota bacterium]
MRYVLIDRCLELDKGVRIRTVKCVTRGEPFLRELDRYPPTLVLETLLQTGAALARVTAGGDKRSFLGKITEAEFPAFAQAGDRIDVLVEAIQSRPDGTMLHGEARVDGALVGRAEFMIGFLPAELVPAPDPKADERRRLTRKAIGLPPVEEA